MNVRVNVILVKFIIKEYPIVFLTTWHCILSAELTKSHSFRVIFCRFCPLVNFFYHAFREN